MGKVGMEAYLPMVESLAWTDSLPMAEIEPRDFLLVAGIVIMLFFVLRIRRMRRGESTEPTPSENPKPTLGRAEKEGLESIVVQIQEVGREFEARLETKIRFAQRLLQEASQVLQQLDVATGRARRQVDVVEGDTDPSRGREVPKGIGAHPNRVAETLSKEETLGASLAERELKARQTADRFTPTAQGAFPPDSQERSTEASRGGERSDVSPGPHWSSEPAQLLSEGGIDPQGDEAQALRSVTVEPTEEDESLSKLQTDQERIQELTDAGQSSADIANEVGRPVGEVELIQALQRQSRG